VRSCRAEPGEAGADNVLINGRGPDLHAGAAPNTCSAIVHYVDARQPRSGGHIEAEGSTGQPPTMNPKATAAGTAEPAT
jgi:hypothetical protein